MSRSLPAAHLLQPGDIVRSRRTMRVVKVQPYQNKVILEDAKDPGKAFGYFPGLEGGSTLSLEMVKKAAPAKPKVAKPKVGDVLVGPEVPNHKWKRGTVLRNLVSGARMFLTTNEHEWVREDGAQYDFLTFTYMNNTNYRVDFLPE